MYIFIYIHIVSFVDSISKVYAIPLRRKTTGNIEISDRSLLHTRARVYLCIVYEACTMNIKK